MSTVAIGTAIAGGLSAAGSVVAGSEQAGAAKSAQQLEAEEQQQALQFQEQEWNTQQQNEAPFIQAGQGAVLNLSDLLSTPGRGLLASYPGGAFTAPTLQQAEQQPGYQFTEQQGEQALQNQAAAEGELLDPNAARAEAGYAENLATTNYNNVYNQALQTYGTNESVWQQQQQNEYNRLLGLSGIGSTAAGQLGQEGQAASSNIANLMLTGGAQQGQQINNAAAAEASGVVGATNAVGGSISNIGTDLALGDMLNANSGLFTNSNPDIFTQSGYAPTNIGPPINPDALVPPVVAGANAY